MNRLFQAKKIFNKNKISDTVNKFINENESIINDKVREKCDINTYPIDKEEIIKKLLKDTKNIDVDSSNNLSKDEQKRILNKIIKDVESNSEKLRAKYNDQIVKEIDELTQDSNITLSNDKINEIIIQMLDFIQIYITNSKTLIDNDAISNKLNYYVTNEIEKTQAEQPEQVEETQETETTEDTQPSLVTFNVEYSDTEDTKEAFEELKSEMKDVDQFNITDVKTPQTGFKNSRLKKIANKKILAVQDLFAYLRNNGFDINLVQNGMIATYYEGFNPFILNGLADTIFYYDNTTTAKKDSRLKKLAEGEGLPAPEPQLALPAGNLEPGYYIVTEGPGHHKENSFEEAEKWLIDNRKDVVVREVINNSYITGNVWEEHEKKIYEKINEMRYEDGPKQDMNYKAVQITIPDDPQYIEIYNNWLNKYKNLFKAYSN